MTIDISEWDDENLDMAIVGIMRNTDSEYIREHLIAALRYISSDLTEATDRIHQATNEQWDEGRWFRDAGSPTHIIEAWAAEPAWASTK